MDGERKGRKESEKMLKKEVEHKGIKVRRVYKRKVRCEIGREERYFGKMRKGR